MAYQEYMKTLIKKVEASRRKRLEDFQAGKHHARIPVDKVDGFLRQYHPDYMEGTKRSVSVGPNKGDIVPNEVADILEARCLVDPDQIDLEQVHYRTDVLIVGGGGAASAAALIAQEQGFDVLMATRLRIGDANTMMAEGGIQAADKPHDSPPRHYLDTMGGGHFSNDPELLEVLAADAPKSLSWLETLGVMFDKEPEGTMKVLHGGGTSRRRMHSAGDMTGAAIMRVLRDEVRNRPQDIRVMEFSPVVELLLDEKGACAGGIVLNLETGQYQLIRAGATIIATGGFGRLHIQGFPTTNHYGATADGIVLAYRVGVPFRFMDASQFHPTGVIYPEQNVGLLITEKVRGAGAQLLNREGQQFVYPLETRDVESSAIIRECHERKKGIQTPTGRVGVWLDSPMLEIIHGPGFVKSNFPAKYRQFERHGIDVSKEPMLVYPTLHYQNGGLRIDTRTETGVPGLFAAGEVTGGVHGRNRLMGNSLLDIVVFGRRAGMRVAEYLGKAVSGAGKAVGNGAEKAGGAGTGNGAGKLSLEHVRRYNEELKAAGIDNGRTAPMILPDYRFKVG
jgi:succinate dehydrogenase/fumarate reductase flavoprotein subunit